MTLTDKQVAAVQARIVRIAERQFAKRGLAATSLRSIAAEMGWTAASLYRYYPNKSALLAATRASAYERFAARIEAAYASSSDLWQRSRAIGQTYVDFAFAEPAAYQMIFAFEQREEDKTPQLRAAEARSRRSLIAYVEDMVRAKALEGSPEILAHVYWAAMHGLVSLHMAGKLHESPSLDLLRHEAARLISRGAGAERRKASR